MPSPPPPPTPRSGALLMALALILGRDATASAQDGVGRDPFPHGSSGLTQRWYPVPTNLPPDPRRDLFYTTRWADAPADEKHRNSLCDGGLYGRRWPNTCARSILPYFRGYPGRNTIGPDCGPAKHELGRRLESFVHPSKPVGMYYAGGSYVPLYDLDPVVPGPGPFPWKHFWRKPTGG